MIGGEENDKMFARQAERLIELTSDLQRRVLLKHTTSILEEICNEIQSRDYKIEELEKQRDRLLTLTVKWCDKSHHDWEEIKAIGDECSFMDLRDSGGLSEAP